MAFSWSGLVSNRKGGACTCTWIYLSYYLYVLLAFGRAKLPGNTAFCGNPGARRCLPRKPTTPALNGPRSLVLAVNGRHMARPRCDLLGASSRRYARQQRPCPQWQGKGFEPDAELMNH